MNPSSWQRDRTKAKSKLRWPATRRGWLNRWEKSLYILEDEVHKLRDAKVMYNTYIKIVFENTQINKGNKFLVFIEDMYLTWVLVGIRRLIDRRRRAKELDFQEMNEAIDVIHGLWHKYWPLICVSSYACSAPHGWERVFDKPWRVSK